MGQKVNPFGYRLGALYTWKSRWYANNQDYKKLLIEDVQLRQYLLTKLKTAGIVDVGIERSIKKIKITLYVSRPGVVIGRGGAGIELLQKEIKKRLMTADGDKQKMRIDIPVEEVKNPDLYARLVAQRLCDQLAGRYPHRRAIAQAMERTMQAGAQGIKIQLAGRIAGAEIARNEKYFQGTVPTQTLRADIDYIELPALTRSGYVGIKVWIHKGEKKIK